MRFYSLFISGALVLLISGCKKDVIPTIKTTEVIYISQFFVTCGGNITFDGGTPILRMGICLGTVPNPKEEWWISNEPKTGIFTATIGYLNPKITYYVRAFATNSVGTAYGSQISFTTDSVPKSIIFNPNLTYSLLSDIDGNTYKTIQIGTQLWMAENLRVTHFNDSSLIPNISDGTEWRFTDIGAYCSFGNNSSYDAIYGHLYNYYAITDSRKLCPASWHIPADTEWTTLINYLGGESLAGGKLKESGFSHWVDPNTSATNESGFSALPAGGRYVMRPPLKNPELGYAIFYSSIGYSGFFWSSTPVYRGLILTNSDGRVTVRNVATMPNGLSVRCIKD